MLYRIFLLVGRSSLILLFVLSFMRCSDNNNNMPTDSTINDVANIETGKLLLSESCIWIIGANIQFNRTWYDGQEHILYLDSNNVSQPLNDRIHDGAYVMLIDITGPEFYEGTITEVFDGYTAELDSDAPTISDGEIDGCILVY